MSRLTAIAVTMALLVFLADDLDLPIGPGLTPPTPTPEAAPTRTTRDDLHATLTPPPADKPPPITTTYFGETIEGDRFVFLLDRSGSMSHNGRLEAVVKETERAIHDLPPTASFEVVAWSSALDDRRRGLKLSRRAPCFSRLTPATPFAKAAASSFLRSLTPRGGTELGPATFETMLDYHRATYLLLSDGTPTGAWPHLDLVEQGHLEERETVHTFGVDLTAQAEAFLMDVAAVCGGRFKRVRLP